MADTQKNGYLTRDGLYKAFALIALSQQGKNISEKSLELLIDAGNVSNVMFFNHQHSTLVGKLKNAEGFYIFNSSLRY